METLVQKVTLPKVNFYRSKSNTTIRFLVKGLFASFQETLYTNCKDDNVRFPMASIALSDQVKNELDKNVHNFEN